jgi:hypothetical protein
MKSGHRIGYLPPYKAEPTAINAVRKAPYAALVGRNVCFWQILLRNALMRTMRLAKVGFEVSRRSTISNRTGDIDAAEQALLHSTGKP